MLTLAQVIDRLEGTHDDQEREGALRYNKAWLNEIIADAVWGERVPCGAPGHEQVMRWKADSAFALSIPPDFVGSVDAALTLVPAHHRWLLDKRPFAESGRPDAYRAEVYRDSHPYRSDRSDVPTHWGPTPALALATACLKARAAGR